MLKDATSWFHETSNAPIAVFTQKICFVAALDVGMGRLLAWRIKSNSLWRWAEHKKRLSTYGRKASPCPDCYGQMAILSAILMVPPFLLSLIGHSADIAHSGCSVEAVIRRALQLVNVLGHAGDQIRCHS